MTGIININKPKGVTSSDVVVKVRKILGIKKVGHFGTLDPIGEGVLPIGVGKATRLFDLMLKKDKVYEASFKFGLDTDTLDTTGNIFKKGCYVPTIKEIQDVLFEFTGKSLQTPPLFSAKNINGKRAYDLARMGQKVELAPSEIEIFDLNVFETKEPDVFSFRIHCSSGTYVRSFGRDLAARLGTYAAMSAIKRTRCGMFELKDSVSPEQLQREKENAVLNIEYALKDLPRVDLDDKCYEYLLNGIKLEGRGINYEKFTLYCKGELFGLAQINSGNKIEIVSYLRD